MVRELALGPWEDPPGLVAVSCGALPPTLTQLAELNPLAVIASWPARLFPVRVRLKFDVITMRSPATRRSACMVLVMTRHSVNPVAGVHSCTLEYVRDPAG